MLAHLRPAIVITLFFTLLLGVAYPLVVTGVAQVVMPAQAGGSLIQVRGKTVGSTLIGQDFSGAQYLRPRPSAAGAEGYDASASSGSNLGPLNETLAARVAETTQNLKAESDEPAPADAVTASASGLDPHISPANADRQVGRIAQARGLSREAVADIIANNTVQPLFGFIGQPAVNVLKANLALDAAGPAAQTLAR